MAVSCPPCTKMFEWFLLLVADLVFFAPTFDLWLFFVIFADIVLMLGEKSGKPALLSLWLVIFFINIVGLLLMWVALGLSIYLVRIFFFFINFYFTTLRLEKGLPQGKIENAYETRLTIAFKSPSTELILQLDYQLTMGWYSF